MTAKERYAKCKTIEELKRVHQLDIMSADTFEFMNACEYEYKQRYSELKDGEQDEMQIHW